MAVASGTPGPKIISHEPSFCGWGTRLCEGTSTQEQGRNGTQKGSLRPPPRPALGDHSVQEKINMHTLH